MLNSKNEKSDPTFLLGFLTKLVQVLEMMKQNRSRLKTMPDE